MTNHIEQAKELLSNVPDGAIYHTIDAEIEMAKAKALVAIAEQLRIGNLIALDSVNSQNSSLFDYEDTQFGRAVIGVKPDIAEALGIGGGSDD